MMEKKRTAARAILAICKQEGIDIDIPTDQLSPYQISKIELLLPVFKRLLDKIED